MSPFEWVLAAVACLAVGLFLAFACRKRRKAVFTVEVAECLVQPTGNERGDWVVRLDTLMTNSGASGLNVKEVTIVAETPDGARMEPKRVTGDKTRVVRQRGHGPDLAMRLPIALRPSRQHAFTFDAFFHHSLNKFFGNAKLRVDLGTEEGAVAAVEAPINPANA